MAVIRREIEQGLAFIDLDAKHRCGVVVDRNGFVTKIIIKSDVPFTIDTMTQDLKYSEQTIDGMNYLIGPMTLEASYKLKNFIALWLDHATTQEPPVQTIRDAVNALNVIDAQHSDGIAGESARAGVESVLERIVFHPNHGLTTSLRDDLISYDKTLPSNKLSLDRSGD